MPWLADPSGDLTQICSYHACWACEVEAADVVNLTSAETPEGRDIAIAVVDGNVILNDTVRVTATDIMASNGVSTLSMAC